MNTRLNVVLFFLFLFIFSCQKTPVNDPTVVTTTVTDVPADAFTFAVIGDFGYNGSHPLEVSELVKSWDPAFIVTVGDNNYSDGEFSTIEENISQYYSDFIYNPDAPTAYRCTGTATDEKQNQFFPCLGNHDQAGDDGYLPYLSFFTLPGEEVFYDFQWGPIHFFTVNSGNDTDHSCCDSEQSVWLKQKLEQSIKPFKLVFFHHAPYSSSKYGENTDMQWPFEEWGADAVLSGHNHAYQTITKKENPTFPYFVNGLGGKSIHDCDVNPLDDDVFNSTCYNDDYGAMRCQVTENRILFQFISLEDPTIPIEEFTIWR